MKGVLSMCMRHFVMAAVSLLVGSGLAAAETTLCKFDFESFPPGMSGRAELTKGRTAAGKAIRLIENAYWSFKPDKAWLTASENGNLGFECWLYRDDKGKAGFIARQDGAFAVLLPPWGADHINVGVWTRTGYMSFNSGSCLKSKTWQHIAVKITRKQVKLLVDGKQCFAKQLNAPMKVSQKAVVIGAGFNGEKQEMIKPLTATLSDVKFSTGVEITDVAKQEPLATENTETVPNGTSVFKFDFETVPPELKGKAKLIDSKPGFGKALQFEEDAYLSFKPSEQLLAVEKNGSLTFECWFCRNEDDLSGFLVRQDGAFAVYIPPWNTRYISAGIWTSAGYVVLDGGECLPSGSWVHVALVVAPEYAELYVNGKRRIRKSLKAPIRMSRRDVVISAGFNGSRQEMIKQLPAAYDAVEVSAGIRDKTYFAKIAASTTENFEASHTKIGIPPVCAPGREISVRTIPVITRTTDTINVENSYYRLELTVAPVLRIRKLFSKITNSECFMKTGSPLLSLHINDKRINPDECKVVKVEEKSDGSNYTLSLLLRHSPSRVEFELLLSFDASESIGLNGLMRNTGIRQRLMPTFPMVENVSIGSDFNENYYYWPQISGWIGKNSYELGLPYGHRCFFQFTDVFSPALGGGLALSGQDIKGTPKGIVTRKTKKNGRVGINYNILGTLWSPTKALKLFDDNSHGLAMAFVFLPDSFATGEVFTFPPARLTVHRGSAVHAIMDYAKWSKQAFPHDPMPEGIKPEFNNVAVHRKVGNGGHMQGFERNGKFAIADNIHPDGRDHAFQMAFWWKHYTDGKFSGAGDYLYDDAFGGREGMVKMIEDANAKGSNVALYTCSRQVGDDSEVARHPEWQYMPRPGERGRSWGSFNPCTTVKEWQKILIDTNVRLVRDLPVNGVYLDTTAEALICHNPGHSHSRNPADGIFNLLRDFRAGVKAANPKVYIMTEYIGSEAFGMYIDACWLQTFAHPYAHAFNNYDLQLARFVYPRVKYFEWGMSPKTFEVDSRRAFFNGIGASRGDLNKAQSDRYADMTNTQREVYDALASENPQPLVPTLTNGLFANYFPGKRQKVWTYYNKAGNLKEGTIPVSAGDTSLRFVELLQDREIQVKDGKISLPMAQYEVGLIAAFTPRITIRDTGMNYEIEVKTSDLPSHVKLVYVPSGKHDSRDQWNELNLNKGKASVSKTETGSGKVIFKLLDGYLLLDETVLN